MQKKLLIFLSIFTFVFGFVVYEAVMLERKFEATSKINNTVLKKLPSVNFVDFESKKSISVEGLTKKQEYLFVHFWATWCAPCEVEFPELVELIKTQKNNKNIKFLLVAVNDEELKVKKFLKKFDLSSNNVLLLTDDIDAHKNFGTYKMPETFLFASSGQLIKKFSGKQAWTQDQLVEYFNNL